jgi:TP901 family phage tail tape measure protein
MSDIMNLAIQITLIDMLSGIASRVKNSILSIGDAGNKVKKDFEQMENSITKGLKAIAVSSYAMQKALPGVKAAGDLQEAMLGVKMNIASSAKDAKELTYMLSQVKSTAIKVSADAPFSAEDVIRIQNSLLKAGVDLKDIVGESGAAFATTALASLSGVAPEIVGDSIANIGTMFKFKGEDYKAFADWLTRVDDAAATNLPALIYGLRMSGSSAAALGISAKDAVTALGALSPLGERAGSSFNNFLISIASKRKELKSLGIEAFEGGKFVGMAKFIDMIKDRFGKIKDEGVRLNALIKIFGEEGGRAANTFINAEKGFKDIESSAESALSMAEKMSIWGEGLNAALKKLRGTAKSTLASIFEPLLSPLKQIVDLLNQATGKLGEFAEKNKEFATAVSGGIGAAAVGAGAYGLYSILKGGAAGARVLKGLGGVKGLLKGFGSTATGIAQGKAIEAATGVTPVFVTNWPANFGSSAAEAAAGLAGKAGILKKLASFAPLALGGKVALAGAIGYAIGTGINWLINKGIKAATGGKNDSLGSWLYDFLHKKENPEVKNNITMNVSIDAKGRVIAETSDMNTKANINTMKRGQF